MGWGYWCAIAAAVCSGSASVFEAIGARRIAGSRGLDVRVVVRALAQPPYALGIGLDTAGFAFQLVALQFLPLFVVQAALAANLAVTAALASALLRVRLAGREWGAVVAVCVGLALLGLAARTQPPVSSAMVIHLVVLAVACVMVVVAMVAARRARAAMLLGAVTGLGTGLIAVAVRLIPSITSVSTLADPALYAIPVAGVLSFTCFTAAIQRGAVTAVTAASVVTETVTPTLVGVLLLGDRPRAGFTLVAVLGFVAAVGGALVLSRFGEVETTAAPSKTPACKVD